MASETKWTAELWDDAEYLDGARMDACVRAGSRVIAYCGRANAPRIAAAQDLYEAASRALNFLLNHQASLGIDEGSADELDSTKLLRAALSFADGTPQPTR